ncbi:MAG: LLM class flavin-dependent oxidoreductase, partial [Chloroflexi bacterium]|nr:LLM class flavin-dependent oxidoreductase [Chloroflexota bacterium]
LTFGFGAGWYDLEYKQYGYEFPERPSRRILQMEEAIRLIKTMWTEARATFHGKYFHVENAMLEPKPVQKPHPPIMIGGSGEKMTLRAVARVGNACNIFGGPDVVKGKFDVLRRHCETEERNFDEIERTNLTGLLLARDEASLKAKRERLAAPDPFRGFAVTVPQAVDLIGQYQDVGVQMFITSIYRNDWETMELLAGEVMGKFS